MTASLVQRALFEQVGRIAKRLSPIERAEILGALDGEIGSVRDRKLVRALERCGGATVMRIALTALADGRDPADALLDFTES